MADKLTVDKLFEGIKGLTLVEANELAKKLEDEFGVQAMAPVAVAAAPGAAPADAAEEKTEFDVILKEVGNEKIKVIKEVRAVTQLGLKEAKDLVEGAPKEVVKSVDKKQAEEVKAKLEAVGAKVEIK
jgi:large subunit ribosomal protein L7/L12